MSTNAVQEWTLNGLLDEISQMDREMPDRSLAFVLGAGASASSGIPTGWDLATRWLKELHQRLCTDGTGLDAWVAKGGTEIEGLTTSAAAAEFYPQIFEKRFRNDPDAGYAELEDRMEGRSPGMGYSMLAEIVQNTRHKVVITTNFDNLVSDALAMHGHKAPLLVGHESLASFVRPQLRRPLVAKIHRDLLLHPHNDPQGVATLGAGWTNALRKLFQAYQPIVIGYGGNDGSLMGFLQALDPADIAGRILWCRHRDAPLSDAVVRLLTSHDGLCVSISGFDEFMLQLAATLVGGFDLANVSRRTERLGSLRASSFRRQAEDYVRNRRWLEPESGRRQLVADLARDETHWWTWAVRADAEHESEARRKLFEQGLRHVPKSAELRARYAAFLRQESRPAEEVRQSYREALERNAAHAGIVGEYAQFLADIGDPEAGNQFEEAYRLDPADATTIRNYAVFLARGHADLDKAEKMFIAALGLDPENLIHAGNYAVFLETEHDRFDEAERMYKRALQLGPGDAWARINYARFLVNRRHDTAAAEQVFKDGIENAPGNADLRGEYAALVEDFKHDYPAAESLYRAAMDRAPYAFWWRIRYADFLIFKRHDWESAEAQYREVLRLVPSNVEAMANLACVLMKKYPATDLAEAVGYAQATVSLCRDRPRQACAEALLYLSLADELQGIRPSPHLAGLRWLIDRGYERGKWDFDPLFSTVLKGMDWSRRKLFERLGDAILHEDAVKALRRLSGWTSIEPASPFEPRGHVRTRSPHAKGGPQVSARVGG